MKYSLLSPSFLPIICSALWLSCQGPTAPFNEKTSELIELKVTEGTNMAVALSPDGNTLAFDLLGRIWLMPVSGGPGQPITDSLGNARQPSWSPDGKKLTFQGYWQGNWHIYIVNADGSNLKQMTSGDYDYREPHWSPDGTTLAFSSDRSGNYDIWTLDVVGEQLIPFTSSPTNEYGPTWSPDGQNLAFVSSDKASGKILIRSIINDSEQTIYNGHGKLTGISWSPTGKQLLFNEHAGIEAALKQINPETGHLQTLSGPLEDVFPFRHSWQSDSSFIYTSTGKILSKTGDAPATEIAFEVNLWLNRSPYQRKKRNFDEIQAQAVKGIAWPNLSPKGTEVVFVALQDLWLKTMDGHIKPLTNDPFVQLMPIWSPDGTSIAYSSDQSGSFAIWILDLTSGAKRNLITTGTCISGMSWSPDGLKIAFTESFGPKRGRLNWVDINSGVRKQLGDEMASSVGTPTWSPDAKIIALTALNPYSSLYREGVNQVLLFPITGGSQRPQKGMNHWSLGVRGNDGPVWSPDGKYMTLIAKGVLWLLPVNGSGDATGDPIKLTEDLADVPSWHGNSKEILYMATDELKLINIDDQTTADFPIEMNWNRAHPKGTTIIHAGGLIDGLNDTVWKDRDIHLKGHRITDILPHDPSQKADQKIDASDAYVMPGLIDLHVHEGSNDGEQLGRTWLSWGVTTVRIPAGDPYDILNRREAFQSGKALGPRIYFTGNPIDGNRIFYGGSPTMETTKHIDQVLKKAELLDYDLIKTYVRLPDAVQKRIIDGAHRMGLPVTSHELYPAVGFNGDGVEHVKGTSRRGFSPKLSETMRAYDDVTDLLASSGMYFTPTTAIYLGYKYVMARNPSALDDPRLAALSSLEYLSSVSASSEKILEDQAQYDRLYANVIRMVADVHRKGGVVVAGTDAPILPQGFGLHIELENYQDAGLSPFEVLQTATINGAMALNAQDDIGTIEVGKLADFIIVNANPLEDIRNARQTKMVIKNGVVWTLDELMKSPK